MPRLANLCRTGRRRGMATAVAVVWTAVAAELTTVSTSVATIGAAMISGRATAMARRAGLDRTLGWAQTLGSARALGWARSRVWALAPALTLDSAQTATPRQSRLGSRRLDSSRAPSPQCGWHTGCTSRRWQPERQAGRHKSPPAQGTRESRE